MSVLATGCGSSHHAKQSAEMAVAPTTPPSGVHWTSFNGIEIPSAEQGPAKTYPDTAPTGYQHNGPGAALAAISATVRMSIANDAQWTDVGASLIAPGPGRDTWAVNRARLTITDPVPAGKAPVVVGYTIDSYTPQRAVFGVVVRQSDQSLSSTTETVVWAPPGDWRLELPNDQPGVTGTNPVTALNSLPAHMITLTPAAPGQ